MTYAISSEHSTTPSPLASSPQEDKRHLRQLRRIAKIRGFRVLKDWTGTWSLVDTRIEPPRALIGLWQVDLDEIDAALAKPPPLLKTRIRRPKPIKPSEPVQLQIVDADYQRIELAVAEPLTPVEVMEERFDDQMLLEKLKLLRAKAGSRQ